MLENVRIGDREVALCANAATPVRYRQVFGKNILKYLIGEAAAEEQTAMLPELAYIMARSAEKADMNRLSIDDYIEWLEDFGAMDFVNQQTASDIMRVYQNQKLPDSVSKKKKGQSTGR